MFHIHLDSKNQVLDYLDSTAFYEKAKKRELNDMEWHSSTEFESLDEVTDIAKQLSEKYSETFLPVDMGLHYYPRYDIIRAPKIGDKVSYAFNGDYYPCGEISRVSPTFKKVTTSTGRTFYRQRQTGCWKSNGTWSMVRGHIDRLNPHF